MATYQNQQFSKRELVVDGERYIRCAFSNCRLIYNGGDVPKFERCKFSQTDLQLSDAASNTAQYLQNLYNAGLTVAADKVLDDIESGSIRTTTRRKAPPPAYTGNNYGRLAFYSTILTVIGLLLGAALYYGYMFYPNQVVLESEPARPLYDTPLLDLYPVLPQQLADIYDDLRDSQLEELDGYTWVDEEAGVVQVPIDEAIELVVSQNVLSVAEEGN